MVYDKEALMAAEAIKNDISEKDRQSLARDAPKTSFSGLKLATINSNCTNLGETREIEEHATHPKAQRKYFFQVGPASYQLSIFWFYALMAMDFSVVLPVILNIIGIRYGVAFLLELGFEEKGMLTWWVIWTGLKVASDVFCAPIDAYFDIRDLIIIYVSLTAPSEAKLRLLEYDRNKKMMKYEGHCSFLRYAMLIKVIEKAHLVGANHGNLADTSGRPSNTEAEWEFKDIWPKRNTGTTSLLIWFDIQMYVFCSVFTMVGFVVQCSSLLWMSAATEGQYPMFSEKGPANYYVKAYGLASIMRMVLCTINLNLWTACRWNVLHWTLKRA